MIFVFGFQQKYNENHGKQQDAVSFKTLAAPCLQNACLDPGNVSVDRKN